MVGTAFSRLALTASGLVWQNPALVLGHVGWLLGVLTAWAGLGWAGSIGCATACGTGSNVPTVCLSGVLMDTWEAIPSNVCVTFVTNVVMVRLVR